MASASAASARLCIRACRGAPRLSQVSRAQQAAALQGARRAFTTTPTRRARSDDEDDPFLNQPLVLKKLDAALAESMTTEGLKALDQLAKENGAVTIDEYIENTLRKTPGLSAEDRSVFEAVSRLDKGGKANKNSFWFDEEDPETNTEEHDEFNEDDITSMAHGKLDEVREMRNYARLAVWELPLLSKVAKPFVPPKKATPLRWRYTTYMGEFHPAEKKVVVEFDPRHLPLTAVQVEKLKKLAGPRYNPETRIIKMSCESFEHPAQNKQHLLKLVDDLVAAAKDPKDTFEDLPMDVRHHVVREKPKFPKSWYMTGQRVAELEEGRQQAALADAKRAEEGLLVDGPKVIDTYLLQQQAAEEEKRQRLAEMATVAAPRGGAKGGANRARR